MLKLPKRLFALSYKHVRLSFGNDARSKIAKGMRVMADVTSKTYGPGGRNVALEYDLRDPKITKDGVTVAKSIFFKDREEELGAKLLKRIAHNTNTYAGDGTTLSTFFSAALVDKACTAIDNGIHPVFLKNGIEKSKKATLEIMQQFVMPVTNKKELMDIWLVASNHNTEIATIVAEAISTIDVSQGVIGNLEIEESKSGKNELRITKGLFIRRGYVSEQFWTTQFGNPVLKEVTLDHPLILVVHDIVAENEDIIKIMDIAAMNKRPLLVFSMDMQEGPLSTMLYNAKKDVLGSCAVNVPFMAGKEEDFLEDIAVITGSKLIKNDGVSLGFEELTLKHFGSAEKVHIGEHDTQIIGGKGTDAELQNHIAKIQHNIDKEDSKHFKKIMRERISRLNQTQAVIGVGGEGEVVIGENRDLIVDSLNSARAALESGILPGGGTALYHASKLINCPN